MKSYLDDIIVSAPSFQQLLQRLGEVFTHMGTMGIKLNISKCHIGETEIKFMGHIVSKEGFRPDPGVTGLGFSGLYASQIHTTMS